MKGIKLKIVDWLLKSIGYKYVAVYYKFHKKETGEPQYYDLGLEGDRDMMEYVDVAGYVLGKKPIRKQNFENEKHN